MNEAENLDVAPLVRPFRESDRDFIEASWIASYRAHYINYVTPKISELVYYPRQRAVIKALITWPTTQIAVAVTPAYDEAILGWALSRGPVLDYCYVKESFRGIGIVHSLLSTLGLDLTSLTYSHVTKKWKEIMSRYPGTTYDPWAAMVR